jgi:hypothetical protein
VLTQRVFPVAYEWGRLALLFAVTAATVAAGDLLLPTHGIAAWASRTALWLALPLVLAVSGFLSGAERATLRELLRPSAVLERLRADSTGPPPGEPAEEIEAGYAPEVYEAVRRDEDRL